MGTEKGRAQVGIGCHIAVELVAVDGKRENLEFDLVQERAADFKHGLLSTESPLGVAVRGKFEGDDIDYRMGDICLVHITSVGPAQQDADLDAQARRQEILDEARRKAERTNADMFASSFSGKWGDYNTEDMDD